MGGTALAQPVEKSRRRWLDLRLLVAALAIAGAVGYLMYTGLQSSAAAYFVTVSELEQRAGAVEGKRVRVGGEVVPGSVEVGGRGSRSALRSRMGAAGWPWSTKACCRTSSRRGGT